MPKPSTTYTIVPQRANGRGFEQCEPHRAQRFAVVEVRTYRKGRKRWQVTRTIHPVHASLRAAQEACASLTSSTLKRPKAHLPSLGARFPRSADAKILARSLTKEQYLADRRRGG